MFNPNPPRHDNPSRPPAGSSAAGNQRGTDSPVEGDSPTHGTVEGPLAAQASPRDAEDTTETDPESEGRPTEDDPRKSDGVAEFKKMEAHAEAGRE